MDVYEHFDATRDFGFRDQICRSAVSVPSNIAEGHERRSHKDFIRFLRIAMGSLAELRTQLYLAHRLGKLNPDSCTRMIDETKTIAAQLTKLIQFRERQA